jgi:hypothetical protein
MVEEQAKGLDEVLLSIRPDGPVLYSHDRDEAFQWYSQKGFPPHDLKTKQGALAIDLGAQRAAKEGIWEEAWAAFHHALAGYLVTDPPIIPRMCWSLGRAQMARGNYDLASLYLEAGQRLANPPGEYVNLIGQLLIDKAVLAHIAEKQDEKGSAVEGLNQYFVLPSGPGHSVAGAAANTAFEDGKANHQWLDKTGTPIRSSLILASGFYHISFVMNFKLGNKRGVGFCLAELGDVYRRLGDKPHARHYWQLALSQLSKVGEKATAATVKQWMREL